MNFGVKIRAAHREAKYARRLASAILGLALLSGVLASGFAGAGQWQAWGVGAGAVGLALVAVRFVWIAERADARAARWVAAEDRWRSTWH